MSYETTLKFNLTPKDVAEKKVRQRKINLLLLIQHYLRAEGYIESYHQLVKESKVPKGYEICDNIELNNILQDYETYYFIRFEKYPKISKKILESSESLIKKSSDKSVKPLLKETQKGPSTEKIDFSMNSMLSVHSLGHENHQEEHFENKLFKPLGSFEGYSDEWKLMAEIISRDILEKNLNVKWDDVVGLDEAKSLLKEAIVYPMKYPKIYEDAISPWKGLLLYGPSGTGKTLLAKAVASECQTTFFNISASSIVSKWRGDSEKLVRVMFDLARLEAPSTIFMDELDAIASQRDRTSEHEASRRLKSELLVQLDGLCQSTDNIFFLTTSNLPWDLDIAILRRLEKKIFVGLPELHDRKKLIELYLPPKILAIPLLTSRIDYEFLASGCEGYSGADIRLLCKEVKMSAVRKVFSELEMHNLSGKNINQIKLNSISNDDFIAAKLKIKSSIADLIEKYDLWRSKIGS